MNFKTMAMSVIVFIASTAVGLAVLEGALRVKNSSMTNYDIEMWRYAKELKVRSANPLIGHTHLRERTAVLQSVNIRTNEWGLRGPALTGAPHRRILFLGGSITLGWGVPEEETVSSRVQQALRAQGEDVEVLNGGVGNYNAQRYVERFFSELAPLKPTDIVVQYFLRDAEELDASRDNILLRNSELAVTMWIAISRLLGKAGEDSLLEHYRRVYREDAAGYRDMLRELQKLADYASANNIRLYLLMTPDVHNLKNYQFGFIHDRMKAVAQQLGYEFLDFLPALGALTPEQIWAMPGDPHPNGLGHKLMADAVIPLLSKPR